MRAMHSVNGKIDNLRLDLQTLRNDMAKLAQEIPPVLSEVRDDSLQAARERINRMKDNIDTSLGQFGVRSREAARALNEATGDIADSVEESLHAHPIAVIAIAVGIGCLLGTALRR